MALFGLGKRVDPIDQAKEWKRNMQKECRKLDRDIANLDRQETKALRECKKLAESGHERAAKILAREIVNTRKAKERMYSAKATMNSVSMQLQTQIATMKLQGVIQKSTLVMQSMSALLKLPEIQQSMMDMSREMERAGLIEEVIGDAVSSMEPVGMDSAADIEVNRVIDEITQKALGDATDAPTLIRRPAGVAAQEVKEEDPVAADNDDDMRAMQARLQSL